MKQNRKEERAQSVIEFVVSYAWMFLIIGIVAYFLYILSAYSPGFTTKAVPGTCHVSRPYGPDTTYLLSLQGTCNNLPPEFVGQLSQANNGYVIIPLQQALSTNELTMSFWIALTGNGKFPQNIIYVNGAFYVCQQGNQGNTYTPWQFLVLTINTAQPVNNANLYVNDTLIETTTFSSGSSNEIDIGGHIPGTFNCPPVMHAPLYGMDGDVANLQVYDTVFNSNEMQQLYLEGIGGEPVQLQSLDAWWPLNGDTLDYSGNGYDNGAEGGIGFEGVLIQNYTPP